MRNPFRCFNSSPEIIRLTVMMDIRYPQSLRQVEDLLFEWGIDFCHETVRFWWNRFGPMFAAEIRKCRDRSAARRLLKRGMTRYGQPKVIVTDRLRSYRAAMHVIGNGTDQEGGRWLNTEPKIQASLSDDGSERWQNSGRRRHRNSSPPRMLRSTTTSTIADKLAVD